MSSDADCDESRRKNPVSRSCISGGILFDGHYADQLSLFYYDYLKECSSDAVAHYRLSSAFDECRATESVVSRDVVALVSVEWFFLMAMYSLSIFILSNEVDHGGSRFVVDSTLTSALGSFDPRRFRRRTLVSDRSAIVLFPEPKSLSLFDSYHVFFQ